MFGKIVPSEVVGSWDEIDEVPSPTIASRGQEKGNRANIFNEMALR
jgi:hypothetical protein